MAPPAPREHHPPLLLTSLPLVTGEAAHATAFARGNISASEASTENLHLTIGENVIASNLLLAIAHARCTATGVIVNSDPNIMGLVVNGMSIPISGKPNQTVALPDGKIIINAQAKASKSNAGSPKSHGNEFAAAHFAAFVTSPRQSKITSNATTQNPQPFQWLASASKIIRKVNKYKETLETGD